MSDGTAARRIGVFNYRCAKGHHSCSNNPELPACPWDLCDVPFDETTECWVHDCEYLFTIGERDEALAEVVRLREAVTAARKFLTDQEIAYLRAAAVTGGE